NNTDNNFDRMYDSREYSRSDDRRFDDRASVYNREQNYPQDGYRYAEPARGYAEQPRRDYREERFARFEDRPVNNGNYEKYPRVMPEGTRPNMVADNENKVVFCSPQSYEDIQKLIDSLKKKQSLIVDVSELDAKNTQRYLDFLSGAIYALNGSYQKIDNKKFYFAPQGVSITIPYDLRQKKE
ncbi:MAG: cell division protein SepF, partial [Clostridia bacterium]|nr:cell division protein SepF [Clostridia bacterium]